MKSPIYFLLTIDTEEDSAWDGRFPRHSDCTVENIRYLPAFHEFCEKQGLKPTYLIDYPVATFRNSVHIIKELYQLGNCEIGAHLHPWCNPPYKEVQSLRNSYVNNLPRELQHQKLSLLTQAIVENLGINPSSYRAGRYGFDTSSIPVLEDLCYQVDTSVVPFRINQYPDEPSFGFVNLNPYYLDHMNVCQTGNSKILEIPITVEFPVYTPLWIKLGYHRFPSIGIRRFLRMLFGIELVWLRPSYANVSQMIQLSEYLIQRGIRFLNMMFHSSELMPGGSPYNKSEEDVRLFLERIQKLIVELKNKYPLKFITLKEANQLV